MGRRKKNQDLQPENGSAPAAAAGSAEIVSADFNYYRNRILDCIREYEIDNSVSVADIKKVQWNAVLIYIYNHVFKVTDSSRKNCIKYKDYQLLNNICDLYIYLCLSNNKDISVNGFCYMTGIPLSSINRWKNNRTRSDLYIDTTTDSVIDNNTADRYIKAFPNHEIVKISNTAYIDIYKKLTAAREHVITDLALDGSVMALAIGKIEYGWIEGKDKQLQADLLQQRINGTDLLTDYKNLYIATADTVKKSVVESDPAAAAGSSADEPQDIV